MITYYRKKISPDEAATRLPDNRNYSLTVSGQTFKPVTREEIFGIMRKHDVLYETATLTDNESIPRPRKPRFTSTPRAEREQILRRAS